MDTQFTAHIQFDLADCDNRTACRNKRDGSARSPSLSSCHPGSNLQHQICLACASAWAALPAGLIAAPFARSPGAVAARQLAMYLAHIVFALSLSRAGALVCRDRATARHACWRMEERREDQQFDRTLDRLEHALRIWSGAFMQEAGHEH